MRHITSRFLLGSSCLVAVACGAGDRPVEVVRTDSAGIEIVVSPGEDRALSWSLERRFALGGADSGPEAFYRVTNGVVGADGRGRIHVLNPGEHQVVVFSPDGDHLYTRGRRGQGPGELRLPGTLAVAPDGTVSIFDFGKGTLVRFGPAGDTLPETPFGFFPWPGPSRHIAETESGFLVANMLPSSEEAMFRHGLQLMTSRDTVILAERSFPQPGMVRYASCGGGLNLPRIFEAQVVWSAAARGVALSRSPDYEVEVLAGERVVRKLRRPLPLRAATEAMALAELGEGMRVSFGGSPCTIPPREMVSGRGFAEAVSWIEEVVLTPDGEIWVRRKEVGSDAGGPIDIFDPSGAYVGTLPAGSPFPLFFIDGSRFGASEVDELDVGRLVIYDVRRS